MKKNIIINLIEKSIHFENDKNFEVFLIKNSIHFYDYLCDYFLLNDLTNIFIEYNLILDNQINYKYD
jgi:hypothetical protein